MRTLLSLAIASGGFLTTSAAAHAAELTLEVRTTFREYAPC